MITPYSKYKKEFFTRLGVPFKKGSKLLDLGCGDGGDSRIFIKKYKLRTFACDIFEHEDLKTIKGLQFKLGGVYKIPFKANSFDYMFLHDVLHHIDEKKQRLIKHKKGLLELKRVCKNNGKIIIVEANRYNPLSYPHMVLMNKHNHFTQPYFKKLISSVFSDIKYGYFECHVYPTFAGFLWKFYEVVMEKIMPKQLSSYNVAIINNSK